MNDTFLWTPFTLLVEIPKHDHLTSTKRETTCLAFVNRKGVTVTAVLGVLLPTLQIWLEQIHIFSFMRCGLPSIQESKRKLDVSDLRLKNKCANGEIAPSSTSGVVRAILVGA